MIKFIPPPETTTGLFGDDIATQGSLDARESGQLGNVRGRRKESIPVFSRGYTQYHKEIGKTRISLGVKRYTQHRYLIDDFLIQYCQKINKKDFATKTENANRKRKGKREYLKNSETREILKELNRFFEAKVAVKRIRNGEHQTIETLINEESFFFRNI